MKKEIKIAVAVVLSIWFFVMGFELGIYKERKANTETTQEVVNTVTPTTQQTTAPTTVPTTAPTTTAPTTTAPTTAPVTGTTDVVPVVPQSTTAPSPSSSMSKQQIIEKANAYVAALKAEQNVKAHKSENIVVNVTDCSVSAAVDIINGIIEDIAGSEEIDYVFTNGKTANGETMFALVPPINKEFVLTDAAVVSATAETVGTDTVYTIVLVEESTTAVSPVPTYNSTAIGYLDLTSLELPAVTITKADMKYPGSTVKITVNAEDKVVALSNYLPMTGYGEAQITFFTGNASFEGHLDEKWTFTY